MTDDEQLVQRVKALETRVRTLEDVEEIRSLHATYHDYVDKGWDGKDIDVDGLREVFTEDISWGLVGGLTGQTFHGIENVLTMLIDTTSAFDISNHSFNNEKIAVSGDTATCDRSDWVAVRREGVADMWFIKAFSRYVRTERGWRIRSVELQLITTLTPAGSSVG